MLVCTFYPQSCELELAGVTPLISWTMKGSQRLWEAIWHVASDHCRFPHLLDPNLTPTHNTHGSIMSCVTEIVLFLQKPVDYVLSKATSPHGECVHTSQSTFYVQLMTYYMTAAFKKLCRFLKQRISLPAEAQNPSTQCGYFSSSAAETRLYLNCAVSLFILSI